MNKLYPYLCLAIVIIIALIGYIYLTRIKPQVYFSICRDEICSYVEKVKFENGCVYGWNMGNEKWFEGCGRYEVKAINKNELPE